MKMSAWIKAFRLRTLPLAVAGIVLGGMLSFNQDLDWIVLSLALLTTVLLQILSNLANDYGDFKKGTDNEERVGPERALQSGVISEKQMKVALIINIILCLLTGIPLVLLAFEELNYLSLLFILLGVLGIFAAIKYTVGKKAFGYSGLGDVFVFLFFGLVAVMGTYYLLNKVLPLDIILPAIAVGTLSAAVLNLNNLRDHVNDKASNKNTLVVKLGFEKAKIYHYVLLIIPFVCASIFSIVTENMYVLISWVVMPIAIVHLKKVARTKDPKEFDPELKKIALSTLLFSILFGLGVLMY
jgi:1,4-dihydroxy-2-naphthoate octaprenyltransferase